MNRLSIFLGWVALTVIAIGVSSAAVGSVGERVSPQPATVLQAAGGVAAFGAGSSTSTTGAGLTTTSIIDPGVAATAVASTSTEPPPAGTATTAAPGSATTTTTVTVPSESTTTTTIIDGTTTTTTPSDSTTTTTSPGLTTTTVGTVIETDTVESRGGWVRYAWTADKLRLGALGPRPGFRWDVQEDTGRRILVRFFSRSHISLIDIELTDGKAVVQVTERESDG